jgi:Family of unknown function (DUF5565)
LVAGVEVVKKIPTLFERDRGGNYQVRDELMPGCEWVTGGEGRATRKWDGTSVLIAVLNAQRIYMLRRHELRNGSIPPDTWVPADDAPHPITGNRSGWIRCDIADPADRLHFEGLRHAQLTLPIGQLYPDPGTYELCGPRIGKNPENLMFHTLLRHGAHVMHGVPTDFEGLRQYLGVMDIEGIVWHHPDGRMAKIKGKDFGLQRRRSTLPSEKRPAEMAGHRKKGD